MTRWNFSSTGAEVVEAFKDHVKGKTVLVTGPSQGSIGAETALSLAAASPAVLILTGRSLSNVSPVIEEIKARSPTTNTHFIPLDLSSQSSVRTAAAHIKSLVSKIDILIHSAGIMVTPYEKKLGWGSPAEGREEVVEGQFVTNYLGAWLLVNLLIKDGVVGEGRVVLTSSSAHRMGGVRFEDINFSDGEKYNEWEAYGQSKTALILYAHSLASKLGSKGLFAYSLHPGSIKSNLQTNMFAKEGLLQEGIDRARAAVEIEGREWTRDPQKTLQQGCSTTLIAALDPEIEGKNGEYLVDGDIAEFAPPDWASSAANQERLWKLSEDLVGEKFSW